MTKELPPLVSGTLYLVATPIGNREDITFRALRVLRECDVIAAEDTRHTANLLQSYEIKKPLLSYFKFNEAKRSEEIIQRLTRGEKIALVTDAGTPGISDPGQRVVRAALDAGHKVESIPGPCAFVSALTASGLATNEIHFIGFLPPKSAARRRRLESLKNLDATIALYESPYRIEKLLTELADIFPDRQIVLARELTKKFEEYLRGTPAHLATIYQKRTPKGEFVVMIDCRGRREESPSNERELEPDEKTPNPSSDEPSETELVGDDVRSPSLTQSASDHPSTSSYSVPDKALPLLRPSASSALKSPAGPPPSHADSLYSHPITTVGALIFGPHDKVLMIQTHKWSNLWGIPGGKPKLGETSEDALRREIKEETNLDITDIQFVLAQDCINSPEFHRPAHFVLLNYTCRTTQTEVTLNDEAEHYRWLTIPEALQLPLNTPTKILFAEIRANP